MLAGADVLIGVSAPNLLTGDHIATMADQAIVFALANPDPEVDPFAAGRCSIRNSGNAQQRTQADKKEQWRWQPSRTSPQKP
jgi:malic enzyme